MYTVHFNGSKTLVYGEVEFNNGKKSDYSAALVEDKVVSLYVDGHNKRSSKTGDTAAFALSDCTQECTTDYVACAVCESNGICGAAADLNCIISCWACADDAAPACFYCGFCAGSYLSAAYWCCL